MKRSGTDDSTVSYTTKSRVVDRVYDDAKSILINYEILPGHQILIEELANHLHVSVTPVREALNRLLNEGFIERQGGRGFHNRSIDREDLIDLFRLRGSLAISAFHFILNTELRDRVPKILADARDGFTAEQCAQIPICRTLLRAVGNKEVLRIYENITDKIHYVWSIYSASAHGRHHIEEYCRKIEATLLVGDLPACIEVIDDNIRRQIAALDELIPEAFARLFGGRTVYSDQLGRPATYAASRKAS